jgi:hypothetical protein
MGLPMPVGRSRLHPASDERREEGGAPRSFLGLRSEEAKRRETVRGEAGRRQERRLWRRRAALIMHWFSSVSLGADRPTAHSVSAVCFFP